MVVPHGFYAVGLAAWHGKEVPVGAFGQPDILAVPDQAEGESREWPIHGRRCVPPRKLANKAQVFFSFGFHQVQDTEPARHASDAVPSGNTCESPHMRGASGQACRLMPICKTDLPHSLHLKYRVSSTSR